MNTLHATATTALHGYQLDAVLSRGRHAVVYLARSPRNGCKVALKLASRAAAAAARGPDGFGAEFALLRQTAHPHIVRAFDHGAAQDKAFLAMEYVEAGDLGRQRGPVPAQRAVSVLSQAASALARLHRHGWVHRDVKPGNLLLRRDGSVALADFGSACPQSHSEGLAAGAVIGTPRYAAPEQQGAGAAAHPTADVYSLGVLFYELLVGEPPYRGTTLMEMACQHLLAPVPRLPYAFGEWQPLLEGMLDKNPGRRWPDGQAILEQLRQLRHPPGNLL